MVGSDLGPNSRFNAVQYPLGDTNCNTTRGHPGWDKNGDMLVEGTRNIYIYMYSMATGLVDSVTVAFVERGCWCGVWFVSFSTSFTFCL